MQCCQFQQYKFNKNFYDTMLSTRKRQSMVGITSRSPGWDFIRLKHGSLSKLHNNARRFNWEVFQHNEKPTLHGKAEQFSHTIQLIFMCTFDILPFYIVDFDRYVGSINAQNLTICRKSWKLILSLWKNHEECKLSTSGIWESNL